MVGSPTTNQTKNKQSVMEFFDDFQQAIDKETAIALEGLFDDDSDYDSIFDFEEESKVLIQHPTRKVRDIVLAKPTVMSDEWFDLCRELLRKYHLRLHLTRLMQLRKRGQSQK